MALTKLKSSNISADAVTANQLAPGAVTVADIPDTVTNSIATKLPLAGGTMTGDVNFGDNVKATFGDSADLEIYHDGSNSYIDDAGEGSLFLRSGTTYIQNATGTKTSIVTNAGAGQTLYHNNTPVFVTTATGIDVTGTVTATGTSVFASLDISGDIDVDGTTNLDAVDIDGAVNMATTALVTGVLTTTAATVHTGGITMPDNAMAIFGDSSDLQIYHDGTQSFISEQGPSGLNILSSQVSLNNPANTENMLTAIEDGAVTLFYDNVAKIATSATGVTVTGNVDTSGTILVGGTNSVFAENNLRFNSGGAAFVDHTTVGQEINFRVSNASSLDTTAMTINSSGIDVTGTVTSDGLNIDGHIIPGTTDAYDIGSASNVIRNIYTGDLHLSNESKSEGNKVDGTKGNWTMQEGEEHLYIINNKSGKKYRFALEEIQ